MGEDNTLLFSCSYNYSNFDDQPLLDSSLLDNGNDDIMGISFLDEEFGEFIDEENPKQGAKSDEIYGIHEIGKIEKQEQQEPRGSTCGENSRKEKPKKTLGTSTPSEMQSVKQEGGVALWVKWRGQWRACIQCYSNDLSTATSRAMPTSSKKTYVVVFFPSSRTYSWVDLEFACHITESPEPLAQGTHEQGRKSVQNLDLPKQHMIRVLVANMLELSDRLPIKAVIESAQNVDAWKQFANEAIEAKQYCDLSRMLIKLFSMIQPSCFSESWIEESYNRWKNECEVADNAQAVEHLNKELVNAILWDELSTLWDAPEQAAVGSEWKDWKQAVIENRNIYPSIPTDSLKRPRLDSPELNNKKAKIQVRRRYPTNFVRKEEPKVEEIPHQVPKPEEEEVSGRSSSGGSKRPITNQQLCAAYIEKKKRQCTRFPSQGSIYCCKHMSLAAESIEGVTKMEESPPEPASGPLKSSNTIYPKLPGDKICEGMTKYGRRCTHRAKEDSFFCKKHSFADAPHLNPETGELISERPVEEGTDLNEQEEAAEPEAEVKDVQDQPEETPHDEKKDDNNISEKNYRRIGKILRSSSARMRCLGRCVNGEQCLHKSKIGSSFCDKHQPESAIISEGEDEDEEQQQPPVEVNEAQNTIKAKTWLSRYMKTANEDDTVESDKLLEWLLSEASRDEHAAETLLKLVNERKEGFENFLKLQGQKGSEVKEVISDKLDKTTCCICNKDFNEMAELGDHWKSGHTDQAQWFLKGYICKSCNKEFRNKSSFDRHSKSEHEGVEALAICTECNGQFADFEVLWEHVVTVHSDHLSASAIDLPMNEDGEREQIEEKEETEEKEVKEKLLEELAPAKSNFPVASEDNNKSVEDEDYADIPSSGESTEQETKQNGSKDAQVYRYKCRICSKQFKLLPDLGRHHQAEHMSAHVGTISKSRTGSSRKKRGKVSKEGQKSIHRFKKALHSVQQQKHERSKEGPTEDEIFETAQTTCCELGLQKDLEAKYTVVPDELFAIVMKMGIERKMEVNWTKDGYVCPENCHTRNRKSGVNPSSRKKSVVICEDISFGKERTPVPCVEDEDNEPCNCLQCREGKSYHVDSLKPWETFTYITRRLLDPSLGLDTKDSQIGCSCAKGRCSSKACDHVMMFDSDYAEACDIWGEEMLGRFPYDNDGRIILQEGYLVYECNSSCSCSHDCPNRVLQRGVNVKLEVFKTRHKGWAVRAADFIPRGTFVCEYLGEVLNDQEANRRGERYDQVGCSYLYDIDVHLNPGGKRSRRTPRGAPKVKPFVIDASKHGNVSRFINHSCSPNLVNYQVLVESMDYQLAHIGLFASRDILCGEELAYNYRYRMLPGKGCPCHCGTSGCRGRLY